MGWAKQLGHDRRAYRARLREVPFRGQTREDIDVQNGAVKRAKAYIEGRAIRPRPAGPGRAPWIVLGFASAGFALAVFLAL